MRAAIIGGLLAIGLLAGCGGMEQDPSEPATDEATTAQELTCLEKCNARRMVCLENAVSQRDVAACNISYDACRDACGAQ